MSDDDQVPTPTDRETPPQQSQTGSDRLWTPWRMRYVGGSAAESGCIFCNRLQSDDDVRSLILHRGEHVFVIMNLFPYNTGHLMIVPNVHVATPETADDQSLSSIGLMLRPTVRALRRALGCEGFNVGFNVGTVAGAGVADHLHQHVVPRWTGDANFMPILASTMVLPELIPVTYAKVRAELSREFAADGDGDRRSFPLVVLNDSASKVAVLDQGGEGSGMLPAVSMNNTQSIARTAASYLADRRIDAILAGWAGPTRALADDRPALTFVTSDNQVPEGDLRFVEVDEARSIFDRADHADTVERAIHHLTPIIR